MPCVSGSGCFEKPPLVAVTEAPGLVVELFNQLPVFFRRLIDRDAELFSQVGLEFAVGLIVSRQPRLECSQQIAYLG